MEKELREFQGDLEKIENRKTKEKNIPFTYFEFYDKGLKQSTEFSCWKPEIAATITLIGKTYKLKYSMNEKFKNIEGAELAEAYPPLPRKFSFGDAPREQVNTTEYVKEKDLRGVRLGSMNMAIEAMSKLPGLMPEFEYGKDNHIDAKRKILERIFEITDAFEKKALEVKK